MSKSPELALVQLITLDSFLIIEPTLEILNLPHLPLTVQIQRFMEGFTLFGTGHAAAIVIQEVEIRVRHCNKERSDYVAEKSCDERSTMRGLICMQWKISPT